ncbi:MAG: mismatch repair protein MutS [Mucilaginibacter sp.]|nr:mismatch repair protein MutS [Mucilaginibacter sp.]
MKYKLGDFVRFVDEKMEGYVTRIIDDQMIGVTGEDDFEIPVPASKVTTVHGFEPESSKTGQVPDQQQPLNTPFQSKGVYVGMVNDGKASSVVHFYLVNDTSYQLLATLITDKQQHYKGEFSGIIAPKTAVKVGSEQLADLQVWPKFKFQLLFYTNQNVLSPEPLIVEEKFKAKDFSGTKKQIPLLNQQGWLIQLDEPEVVIDAQKLKESFFRPAEEKTTVNKPQREVDLHIEKLRNDHQFLSSAEMLDIQMEHFHSALDAAIVHQYPEIVFIHGVGNGILKHEIHKALSRNNKIQTFMDAQKDKFGYGATKIILK